MAEKLIRESQVDAVMAAKAAVAGTAFRTELDKILPRAGTTVPAGVVTSVAQRGDGTWPNPVRDSTAGIRVYSAAEPSRPPAVSDGLRAGDLFLTTADGFKAATYISGAGAVTWTPVAGGGGGIVTPPVDPPAGDTSPLSPTARPNQLLASTGTWSTSGGVTLVQALSDQSSTAATATPINSGSGVSVTLGMTNFQHASGNDLTVTLTGASSAVPGDVVVVIGYQGLAYAAPVTKSVTTTPTAVSFKWPADSQLSLPVATWKDIEVTVSRVQGGLVIADVALQSQPPVVVPPVDPEEPVTPGVFRFAGSSVWYSQVRTAPPSIKSAATAAYVAAQAGPNIRLDVYADSDPVWMVPASTPRVNITPLTSNRGPATLMHTTDGKGALDGVPIPPGAVAPSNTFKTATILCVETDQVWEFLGLVKSGTAWSAEWGGRIDKASLSGGAYPTRTGYTGSGLAWVAGAVKVTEAQSAVGGNITAINHALALNLKYDTAASSFTWPATRSDGTSGDPNAPKMGQRVRLKASYDVAASNLTPIGKAVANALQSYGAVIIGGADRLSIAAESGTVVQAQTGVDPWGAILGSKSVDDALAGIPLTQLEAVSPGWGTPGWVAEDPGVDPPVDPPVTPPGSNRRAIYINPGQTWLSGASCRGIEKGSEGMGSAFATWRGEPAYMARTWADVGGPSNNNDPELSSLFMQYNNWHASIDEGPGFFGRNGQSMAAAARGDYVTDWKKMMTNYRRWWTTRRDPSKVNPFLSPAHEFNGSWYPWSVNSGNSSLFIQAWKRFREAQLQVFPEALLCLNANSDSVGANMDWRNMVAGRAEGKVKDFVDVGGVDYYNMDPNVKTLAEWNTAVLTYDRWGGPRGLERHRQFWESCGLPMQIPEWSNNAPQGDSPVYATEMNNFMRKHAGTGPGKVCADAIFNLSAGYSGKYAVMGDEVGSPQFAARYQSLVWGR